MKTGKTPGLGKLPPDAIKEVANYTLTLLLQARNNLITPNRVKVEKVTLILKNGEFLSGEICILNILSKLFENLIRNKLHEELNEREGLHPRQGKGKSTIITIEAVMKTAND